MTDLEIHQMRGTRDILQKELEAAGVVFRGKSCRCPFHDDRTPSADIYERDGVWRFHCFPCNKDGDIFDVRAWLNKSSVDEELTKESMRRAAPAPTEKKRTFPTLDDAIGVYRNVQAVYKYTNPDTSKIDLAIVRYQGPERKQFAQITPAPGGEWWLGGLAQNPLYNRTRLRSAKEVVIVEGEKCVHALAALGIVATTSPSGASAADKADWEPCRGKRCILWQDNDEPGTAYIETVRRKLSDLGCPLAKVGHEEMDLPEGGDVADFIDRFGADRDLAMSAVADALADARPIGRLGDYFAEMAKIIAGERDAIHFPWQRLTHLSQALMPGTVTCFFGPPSAAKSYFMMECLIEWTSVGIRACAYELEDDHAYHMRRAHAQIAQDSRIMVNDWIKGNGPIFEKSGRDWAQRLEEVGKVIWDAADETITLEMVETWVEGRCRDGFQIIIVDPVTAATSSKKVWVADQEFVFKIKMLARRYHTRVILVTHPRKNQKPVMFGLDDMAGGAAYQRFAHTVLLMERLDKYEDFKVKAHPAGMPEPMPVDRVLRIAKARNGPGSGKRLAFQLRSESLRFDELGTIEE